MSLLLRLSRIRDMQKGSAVSSMMLGKRIIDTKMSISQWADTPEYKGQKLLANYKVDVDGVAPKKSLPIIENGILKTLLTGRHPAIGVMSVSSSVLQYQSVLQASFMLA